MKDHHTDKYDCIDEDGLRTLGFEWSDWREVEMVTDDGDVTLSVYARFNNGDIGPDPQEGPSVEVIKVLDENKCDVTDDVDLESITSTLLWKEYGNE